MRGKYSAILGAGVTALAVAGTLVGVQYLDTGTDAAPPGSAQHELTKPSNRAGKASGDTVSAETKNELDFKLTYVPDGFHLNERYGPRTFPPRTSGPSTTSVVSRSVHYNNISENGSPSVRSSKKAAFEVSVTTGYSAASFARLKSEHPEGRSVEIDGQQAFLRPTTPERKLTSVTWRAENVRVRIVGRGLSLDQLLPIARGVRLP